MPSSAPQIPAEGNATAAQQKHWGRGQQIVDVLEERVSEVRDEDCSLQRFRYEGGDLDYAPPDSAPADWDGNLADLIGDYFRAEDVEALLSVTTKKQPAPSGEWPAAIYLSTDPSLPWRAWRDKPASDDRFESRRYVPAESEGER